LNIKNRQRIIAANKVLDEIMGITRERKALRENGRNCRKGRNDRNGSK
jgi:hypothetical protein